MTDLTIDITEIGDLATRVGINGAFQDTELDRDSTFDMIVGIVAQTNTVPAPTR